MNLALVAIVLAIGAGAVLAVSSRDDAASATGLAVALVASALLSDPLPSAAMLGVQVVADLVAYSDWGIAFTRQVLAGTPGAERSMEAFFPSM